MAKIGRNQPCPCGSGKKYKRCCGNPLLSEQKIASRAKAMFKELEAKEQNRIQQQGHGRPIVATDFNDYKMVAVGKPRRYTLKEAWRMKQKHIDLFALEDAMKSYPQIPNQFDGDLPPVGPGERERIKIGAKYDFEGTCVAGEVTTATVVESENKIYVGVSGMDGKGHILSEDISDAELEVYRKFPDTYFGVVQPAGKQINDPFEFFEWALSTYSKSSKEKLLEFMKDSSDFETLQTLDQEELALEYCERMTYAAMNHQSKNPAPPC